MSLDPIRQKVVQQPDRRPVVVAVVEPAQQQPRYQPDSFKSSAQKKPNDDQFMAQMTNRPTQVDHLSVVQAAEAIVQRFYDRLGKGGSGHKTESV